jgi:hypothetical protein
VGIAKGRGEDASALLAEVAGLGDEQKDLERELDSVQAKLRDFLLELPNVTHPSTPVGHSADDNVEVRRHGTPRAFDFPPKDHTDLGETLGMLDGGADPLYVGRRLIRMAREDIGLADPRALTLALDAVATYERLGSPEGELALAQCVIYLACAAKSNAVYTAYGAARAFIAEDGSRPVPMRLRNAPTRLMKRLGHGKGYRYAHDEAGAYAAGERYLPDDMADVTFYEPTAQGLEMRIRERLAQLRQRDAEAGGKHAPPPAEDE